MAAAKKVAFEVEVKTSEADDSIASLREELQSLKDDVEAYKKSSEEATEKMRKGFEAANKGAKNAGKGIQGVAGGIGKMVKSLGIITLIVEAFMLLKDALNRNQKASDFFAKTMTAVEVVMSKIVEDGIIPLAEWLGKLFTDPQTALNDFVESTTGIRKWFEDIVDFIATEFLVSWTKLTIGVDELRLKWNELTGDTEEAADIAKGIVDKQMEVSKMMEENAKRGEEIVKTVTDGAKEAFETISDTVDEALDVGDKITKLENAAAIGDATRAKRQLELQKEAEIQRQIRDDTSRNIEDRIAANEKLGGILDNQIEVEKEAAQSNLDLVNAKIAAFGKTTELEVQQIQAQTELIDIEERVLGQRSEQLTNLNGLIDEQKQALIELSTVGKSAREAELIELQNEYDQKVELAIKFGGDIFEIEAARANALAELDQKFKDEELKAEEAANKKLLAAEQKLAEDKIKAAQTVGTVLGNIAALINDQSREGVIASKVLGAAQIAIDAAVAVSGAIAQAQSVPYPGNLVAIGTGVAAVLGAIASASSLLDSANVPGPSANISGAQSIASSAPTAPQVTTSTSIFGEDQISQIEIAPVQAFVVESEMTQSQYNIEQIQGQAAIGPE